MIAASVWKSLLDALGQVLSFLYNHVPGGYGVAIILLTVAVRLVLLPLGIKQIRSMQAMQAIQPKVKQLQAKYKGKGAEGRQKLNEEMMALYKEYGVNPLSGCLPLLAQFPVLIALFGVLRVPVGLVHIPNPSPLHAAIQSQHTSFLGTNLLCSAAQAGKTVEEKPVTIYNQKQSINGNRLNCGSGTPSRLPYYAFALVMVGTTFYQQRQMQKATPQGNQQQQALTRIMPLLFGVWGFLFPAGLIVYWTTTNIIQIAQQQFMLPKIQAAQGGTAEAGGRDGGRRGTGGDGATSARGGSRGRPAKPTQGPTRGKEGSGTGSSGEKGKPSGGRPGGSGGRRPGSGGTSGNARGSGGSGGGDRKKRRKR